MRTHLRKMRTHLRKAPFAVVGALAAALTSACIDEETPAAPTARGHVALSSAPLESLGEMPPFIEIAREVPTFGGFWFNDQDQIVVALTDLVDVQRVVAMIPEHLGAHKPSGGYVATKVTRPFADLARFRAALRVEVFGLTGVVSLGVHESANRVEVGITNAAVEPAVRALARTLGIPDDALAVLNVPPPRLESHTLRDPHPAAVIEGGWEIASSRWICTLGFPAIRSDGSHAFVTNSHCTATSAGFDGGAITQPFLGVHVGSEILDPAAWACGIRRCRNSDAALISAARPLEFWKIGRPTGRTTADVSGGPLTIDHVNPTFTISGRNDNVFLNETLEKVGRTTGWSGGSVEETCTDIFFDEDGWVRLCSHRVDYASDEGDSGSPVFYWKADGTAELRGIHFGRSGGLSPDGLMSGIHQIELDLGELSVHTVIAHINGPTSVPPNSTVTWTAVTFGGKAPFTFAWYRNGALVSNSSSYTGNTGPWGSSFELRLDISDALGDTSSDIHPVSVGSKCGPPIGAC